VSFHPSETGSEWVDKHYGSSLTSAEGDGQGARVAMNYVTNHQSNRFAHGSDGQRRVRIGALRDAASYNSPELQALSPVSLTLFPIAGRL
jgi:hypothetical protein